jgi:hypothetical protein
MTRQILAGLFYTTYSNAVGGVNFQGDPLPSWTEFSADPAKAKQADGWLAVADSALLQSAPEQHGGPAPYSNPPPSSGPVAETKAFRLTIKSLVDELNTSGRKSRSRSLAVTKLEESSMWLGKDLQELNEPNPYPKSHDPADPVIDPTAPEACNLTPADPRPYPGS